MDKSISTDESRQRMTSIHRRVSLLTRPPRRSPSTPLDPVIDKVVEHPSDRKLHPDAATSVETTQVSESDLLAATGVRTVFAEKKQGNSQDRPQNQNGQSKNRSGQHARQQDAVRGRIKKTVAKTDLGEQQPSMMKILLITAGVALVCGVIGAMGYVVLFRAEVRGIFKSEESQGKSDSGSKTDRALKEVRRWGK